MDLHTLHIEHAVLLGLLTLLTVVNSLLHRAPRGGRWFPVYTFSAFIGAVLIALRGTLPDPVSIFFGDLLFPLAYVCLHRSLTEFFDEGSHHWRLQLGLLAVAALVVLRWGVLTPNTTARLLGYSLVLCAQTAVSGAFVLRRASGGIGWSARMMGGLLLMLSANNLWRAVVVSTHGAPANYLHGGGALAWTLLWTTVLQGAVTIAFVWMTAERLRQDLEIQATTDPLTRLLNRRAIERRAEREIAMSRMHGGPLSAILVDLDEFKTINDAWGHGCGDAVLLEVAQCLQAQMREGDALARLGGDEFVALLPRTSRHEALGIAECMRSCLEELRCVPDRIETTVRASFGVAELDESYQGWQRLMHRCDQAMYRVKDRGGNRVLVY